TGVQTCALPICGLEAVGLVPLPHEGAHHADPHDLLAHHRVDRVDVVLHPLEQRHQPCGQEAHDHHQDRHRDPHQPGQPRVLLDRHDDPADGHDRHHHHEVQRHQHQHLHLLDVVGGAGDEGGCAVAAHLLGGEAVHAG